MRSQLAIAAVIGALLCAGLAAQQTKIFTTGTPAELTLASQKSLVQLRLIADRHAIRNIDDLVVTRVWVDELSMAHVRVQQHFRGIPVFGGEAIVHLRADGEVFGETDDIVSDVAVDIRPTVAQAEAIRRAATESQCDGCRTTSAELWILRRERVDRLTYRVELLGVRPGAPSSPVVFIDAHNGGAVLHFDNIQTGANK